MNHTLVTGSDGLWYWRNWLGLVQSPYFETRKQAEVWKERFK